MLLDEWLKSSDVSVCLLGGDDNVVLQEIIVDFNFVSIGLTYRLDVFRLNLLGFLLDSVDFNILEGLEFGLFEAVLVIFGWIVLLDQWLKWSDISVHWFGSDDNIIFLEIVVNLNLVGIDLTWWLNGLRLNLLSFLLDSGDFNIPEGVGFNVSKAVLFISWECVFLYHSIEWSNISIGWFGSFIDLIFF